MAVEVLRAWRLIQDQEFRRLGAGRNADRHVFTRMDGEWNSPRGLSHAFQDVVKKLMFQASPYTDYATLTSRICTGITPM